MRVHVTELRPGDRLQADTFNDIGLHVLHKGKELKLEEISKLIQHGIAYVEVDPSRPDEPTASSPFLSGQPASKVEEQVGQAVEGFESLYLEALSTGRINTTVVNDIMEPLVDRLSTHTDVVSLLLSINPEDEYTYQHSVQVGILSYYISTWLGYAPEEAYAAGKAGFLHDIGKCLVPAELLYKPGKLTPEEFEEMKRHTVYGYDIIRSSTNDEIPALVALQHHERDDGSGYPHQCGELEVHPFSRITAVADVFSAMTTNRVYQTKQELLTVLRELYSLSFGKLSPRATQAFISHMLPNFIGKRVTLTSGETGTIIMTNPADFFRPLVKTKDRFIDLSSDRNIAIDQIYM
ncbi:HD family phosphohydrolase [Paenibacillus rhizosphaerae]|uniref:HD family phosphohydrolase n=2 Tax=Paenibacillus TaxID=44249 RepID=A0A1R1ERV8_9BACL|nr:MULTISPECIES: HD-GYP domain-containing protein [Paenibacillus]OMF54593.1 HD family phosphohydrolase [Paenibacillus rhizosphaerae]UYO04394.1 HD-GYP domain-containing protein [Paenibacillus sp. PSB04]GIO52314.1 HD family phosphohydrolase [Paenibacillus cineris]